MTFLITPDQLKNAAGVGSEVLPEDTYFHVKAVVNKQLVGFYAWLLYYKRPGSMSSLRSIDGEFKELKLEQGEVREALKKIAEELQQAGFKARYTEKKMVGSKKELYGELAIHVGD